MFISVEGCVEGEDDLTLLSCDRQFFSRPLEDRTPFESKTSGENIPIWVHPRLTNPRDTESVSTKVSKPSRPDQRENGTKYDPTPVVPS